LALAAIFARVLVAVYKGAGAISCQNKFCRTPSAQPLFSAGSWFGQEVIRNCLNMRFGRLKYVEDVGADAKLIT